MDGGSPGAGPSAVADEPADGEGERFGPYRLIEVLGRGGMGEVWRAYDTRRERVVALKRLSAEWGREPVFRQRFALEARVATRIASAHVVVIHDWGEVDGRLFIDMRLVDGGDLAGLLRGRSGGLDVGVAVELCAQVGGALDAAHRAHLVHRDVKPSNVLLAADGPRHHAYLVDFGIAKLGDELTGAGLTSAAATMGTPAYMAPELFDGATAAGVASDVYALGCVLFEMLTGRRVFLAATAPALMAAHVTEAPPAVSAVRPGLAAFDAVLARALDKDPARRHPSAAALAEEAARALAVTGGAAPAAVGMPDAPSAITVPVPGRPRPWLRRRALVLSLAVALVIGGGTTAGLLWAPWSTPERSVVTAGLPQKLVAPLSGPAGVAFTPDGGHAYIADTSTKAIIALDTSTQAVTGRIPLPSAGSRVTMSPDGRRAYTADTGTDDAPGHTVTVIDTDTNAVVATIPVGSEPVDVALSPDGGRAYVSNGGSGTAPGSTVSVIDTATSAVVATYPAGVGPGRLALSPDGRRLFVPDAGSSTEAARTVTVIDVATGAGTTAPVGDWTPRAVLPSPDGRRAYVVCGGSVDSAGSVQVLDTAFGTVSALGGNGLNNPFDAALSPDGRTLVVPESGSDAAPSRTVSLIDTAGGARRTMTIAGSPVDAAITPDGSAAWVTAGFIAYESPLWRIPLGPE